MSCKINQNLVRTAIASVTAVAAAVVAYGGVPLNNLQGTGGIAFQFSGRAALVVAAKKRV